MNRRIKRAIQRAAFVADVLTNRALKWSIQTLLPTLTATAFGVLAYGALIAAIVVLSSCAAPQEPDPTEPDPACSQVIAAACTNAAQCVPVDDAGAEYARCVAFFGSIFAPNPLCVGVRVTGNVDPCAESLASCAPEIVIRAQCDKVEWGP